VVAPAPELGRVPFGLLGLGKAGVHLAHGAVVRLGASANLLNQIRRREPARFHPRVLGVIDPRGKEKAPGKHWNWSLLADRQLHQMGVTDWAWLKGAQLLSRSGRLPDVEPLGPQLPKEATADELGKALRSTDAGVLAYIGHVWSASDDVATDAGLVLANDDLLSAHQLFSDTERRWPMPARVALIGCGSGGACTRVAGAGTGIALGRCPDRSCYCLGSNR